MADHPLATPIALTSITDPTQRSRWRRFAPRRRPRRDSADQVPRGGKPEADGERRYTEEAGGPEIPMRLGGPVLDPILKVLPHGRYLTLECLL